MPKYNIVATVCSNRLLTRMYCVATSVRHRLALRTKLSKSLRFAYNLDEELPEDIEYVLQMSAVLEIKEYDYFDLAYRWWFGRVPESAVLESHFARYMFNKFVPHWVRQYSRMILKLHNKGRLDREALGIQRLPDATPQSIRAGIRYTVAIGLTLTVLVVIAQLAAQYSGLPCMFPPCH